MTPNVGDRVWPHPAAKSDASDDDILRAQAIWGSVLVRARVDANGIIRYAIICEDPECAGKCERKESR